MVGVGKPKSAVVGCSVLAGVTACASWASAASFDYPEAVVQWVVQQGETCAGISTSVYGSPAHIDLLHRYNTLDCGATLSEGLTLVLPASVTVLPDARLRSMSPAVQTRPSGGGWSAAQPGVALYKGHNVNTLETGRADIEFADRTRIFLAENTLVVIYGTAANTAVQKNARRTVELDQGEIKAGLAALRGNTVDLDVKGGGAVRLASKDSVVQRKGERTTVAVFDGTAQVSNGGKKVDVPTYHGTRFQGTQPPIPPRPLPPRPEWDSGGSPEVVLARAEGAVLTASWQPVPKAKSYRFEISRDEGFRDLIAREEVPSQVRSFRAEKIPPGVYYVSVRAIDDEDYLGIASQKRSVQVLPAVIRTGSAALNPQSVEVTRYTVLSLAGSPTTVRMALDQGELGAVPTAIDFGKVHPAQLRFQSAGGPEVAMPVTYRALGAVLRGTLDQRSGLAQIEAGLTGFEGIAVAELVKPFFRVHLPSGSVRVPATVVSTTTVRGSLQGSPGLDFLVVEFVDGTGVVLGRGEVQASAHPREAPAPPPAIPSIGVLSPPTTLSTETNVLLYSPSTPAMASLAANANRDEGEYGLQGLARASGGLGRFGIDATLASKSSSNGQVADESAWLGARVRTYRYGLAALEQGFALRVGLPTTYAAPGPRLEPSIAFGGAVGKFTWLSNAGVRIRMADSADRVRTPAAQGFLLAGGTYAAHQYITLYGIVDGHLLGYSGASAQGRGGLSVGLEAGSLVYAALGIRVSPFTEEAPATLSLAFGYHPK